MESDGEGNDADDLGEESLGDDSDEFGGNSDEVHLKSMVKSSRATE